MALDPAPDRVVVVLSGGASPPAFGPRVELITPERRLGFAAAVNVGVSLVMDEAAYIAVLNDDAVPPPNWLGALRHGLENNPDGAAIQGTITGPGGTTVDGRGIVLDRWCLPTQVDRGTAAGTETPLSRPVLAVSGTAALFRTRALKEVFVGTARPFDPVFGSYHEDLDLGLRLGRLGWRASWLGGTAVRHLGSASGSHLKWRHPWWLLVNRWRALAGNLTLWAFVGTMPRMLRGELRAINTLVRSNPRALPVAAAAALAWPVLVARGLMRKSPGPRLTMLPMAP
jgi:GT2 family glycosyltransferase